MTSASSISLVSGCCCYSIHKQQQQQQQQRQNLHRKSTLHFKIQAQLGSSGDENSNNDDVDGKKKKKFITRDQEPEEYWQSAGERQGENPMMTPLPYIIIFGMSTPFIILAIAFANGWIKAPLIR